MTEDRDAFPIRLGRMLLHVVIPERWETSLSGDLDEVWSAKWAGKTWGSIWYLCQALAVSFCFSWETWKSAFRRKLRRATPGPGPSKHRRRFTFGSILGPDLKYAFRCLLKSPGFTAIAVLIMGLGIGANTAIFSIVNGLLFASLPYKDAASLVRIYTQTVESSRPDWLSYPDFLDYRDGSDLFSAMAAASDGEPLSIVTEEGSEFVIGEAFSAELFSMLDVPPVLGRSFLPEENEPGSELVAMVSYSVWQLKHGGDCDIIGKTLQVNGFPVTVVGVGPEGFQGSLVFITTDYWLSWGTADAIEPYVRLDDRDSRNVRVFARLKPGVGLERAEAQLDTLAANLSREYPESGGERRALVIPATEVRIDPLFDKAAYPLSAFLMIIVGLVLVVACSNLAGLLLMRASSRQKEIAVRQALGAGRWRLVSLLLTESALLGILGGAVGLLIAFWTAGAILSYKPPLPIALTFNFQMDERVLTFNLLLSLATGVLFGLAPALKASRCDLVGTLKDEVPALGMGRKRFTLRNFFVVVQVAVSLVLLIGAGLFIRNLINWRQVDPGFETERAALAVVDVSRAGYDTEEKGRAFFKRYRENIASLPGVEAVAIASRVPLGLWGMDKTPVQLPDSEPGPEEEVPQVELTVISHDYFDALSIPVLRGRSFDTRDTESSRLVAVVSEAMARRYWD